MNILIIIIIIIIILLVLNSIYFNQIENFKYYPTLQRNYDSIFSRFQSNPILDSELQIPPISTIQVLPNSSKIMKNFLFE